MAQKQTGRPRRDKGIIDPKTFQNVSMVSIAQLAAMGLYNSASRYWAHSHPCTPIPTVITSIIVPLKKKGLV